MGTRRSTKAGCAAALVVEITAITRHGPFAGAAAAIDRWDVGGFTLARVVLLTVMRHISSAVFPSRGEGGNLTIPGRNDSAYCHSSQWPNNNRQVPSRCTSFRWPYHTGHQSTYYPSYTDSRSLSDCCEVGQRCFLARRRGSLTIPGRSDSGHYRRSQQPSNNHQIPS